MALKSGRMAYLHVDQSVFVGANKFLDSVQTDGGASYGYKDPGNKSESEKTDKTLQSNQNFLPPFLDKREIPD